MHYLRSLLVPVLLLALSFSLTSQSVLDNIITSYGDFESSLKEEERSSWNEETTKIVAKKIDKYRKLIAQLNALDYMDLSEDDRVNADMLKYILEDRLYLLEYGIRFLPLNSEGGFLTSILYRSGSWTMKDSAKRENYLSQLRDLPGYLGFHKSLLEEGIKKDLIHPKLVVSNCISILDDMLSKSEEEFILFEAAGKADYQLDEELKLSVIQALTDFRDYLRQEYLPEARTEIGASENNYGKRFYRQRVRYFTSLDMTPEEVFELGMKEVARIRSEMYDVLDSLEYDGDLEQFIHMLRTDQTFYPKSEKELLYYASWLSKKAEEILPRYFGRLPRLPFTVNPVPEAIAPNYTTGRYSGGSMENMKAGQYLVNTYKLESRPLYLLTALTLHEAVPGHHLQGSLQDEMTGLPNFRKEYLSAYGEGWGLYAEFLGREAGMYESLYDLFGSLSYEMWRACRLVVDPGMHYLGWSRDEAMAFMMENTSLSAHEVNTEINRYIGWPGQAVSYKIGELKIRELRKKAESELGSLFDIREFHDIVLSKGSIPLKTLERIIDNYIQKKTGNEQKN